MKKNGRNSSHTILNFSQGRLVLDIDKVAKEFSDKVTCDPEKFDLFSNSFMFWRLGSFSKFLPSFQSL